MKKFVIDFLSERSFNFFAMCSLADDIAKAHYGYSKEQLGELFDCLSHKDSNEDVLHEIVGRFGEHVETINYTPKDCVNVRQSFRKNNQLTAWF